METIIPILIAAIIFGAQAYSNFQKEKEKARKRNPGQPRTPVETDRQPFEGYPDEEEPQIPDYWEKPAPQRPAPRRTIQHNSPRMDEKQLPAQEVFDEYSGVLTKDEVKRIRQPLRKQTVIPKKTEVSKLTDSNVLEDEEAFDLRDAVIKAAILERPYQ
ncbi:hypothetical protein [Parapedobacter tibetensis]|uniref:hypothetical protein n=1 Tax=Parapedobacter tibetensis TaxID=2972951 RepID=UPI00214DBCE5|nr:hypothetical protein [Parapedobacter tibetensis]